MKAIIDAESQPLKQLEQRKQREESKIKLFGEFKSKFSGFDKSLSELGDFKKFRELKVDLGDAKDLVGVTVDKEKAQPGTYEIQIDSLAQRSSVISNGFKDPNEPVLGMGFVVVDTPDGKLEVFVDDNQSSLYGVMRAINESKKAPIQAAVVKDVSDSDNPWRLVLSAKNDGADHNVDFPEFYFLESGTDFWFDADRSARNAEISIDGFPIEVESNHVKDFLPGVNLHLKQAKPDQPFTISISEDPQKIAGKVKTLVDQINDIFKFITQQNAIDEKTDTRTTFAGDTSLQNIEYRIRNILHEGFPVWDNKDNPEEPRLVFLSQIGVEFEKTGQLTFKEDKFVKALESDYNGVSESITGPEWGFANQLRMVMGNYTRAGTGLLAIREKGMRSRITDIDQQIDSKSRQLDRKQQMLTDKFARLEGTLSNMQRQQQYLSATMGGGGGGNMVQQLLGG